MGFSLFGKKGDDPGKMAAKGLKMLPGMEQRQLSQTMLMQKLLSSQMGEANVWEKLALMNQMDNERAANESVDASARKTASQAEQASANAGMSNVTSSIGRRKQLAGRGAKEKRLLSAQRGAQQTGIRQAAAGMRGQVREGQIGVQQNIQNVKAQSDLQKLHLTTKNSVVGQAANFKAPSKGMFGTLAGAVGYGLGGPTGGMIGQALGDSFGSAGAT